MQNSLHRLSVLLLVIFFLSFNIATVQTKPAAPPSGGVAGDPSRSSCAFIGCHPGPELAIPSGGLDLNMGTAQGNLLPMLGQTYTPGQAYLIELKPLVTNGNNTRYGFQATALDASGNMAGAYTITDATHTSAQSLLSRNYIGHKDATTFNDWTFTWTAPATNVGKITFYYAIDAANNDGSTSGDKVYKGSTDLMPNSGTGISENGFGSYELNVFPNPATDKIFISFESYDDKPIIVVIYSLDGKRQLFQNELTTAVGKNNIQINLKDRIESGMYLLELNNGDHRATRRIVVL